MNFAAFDCFKEAGNWYRGNLHNHAGEGISHGYPSAEEVIDWYEQNGYDFLAITYHHSIKKLSELKKRELLLIPGVEIIYGVKEEASFLLDMLAVNITELPDFLDPNQTGTATYDNKISPQRIIDYINSVGGLAIMCHPNFQRSMIEPYLRYHSYIGLEVYNDLCAEMRETGNAEIYWDALLTRGIRTMGFACDDSGGGNSGTGWIEVKAKEKTIPAILDAIRVGKFYATNGVKIYGVEYTEESVKVIFDRPCDVAFMSETSTVVPAFQNGNELLDKRFPTWGKAYFFAETKMPKTGTFLRIELTDANGKKAYTNPVYFGEWERK